MDKQIKKRKTREDWVRAGLEILQERGVDGVKIVVIARRMNVTSGSFYWHFKDLQDLLTCLLDYWERELTDGVIVTAQAFDGPPAERIHRLMQHVIKHDAAFHDHAILIWARRDTEVREIFERTLQKRFTFAQWMFTETGFSSEQAAIRGRLMVTYLMGESSSSLKSDPNWKQIIEQEFKLLTSAF